MNNLLIRSCWKLFHNEAGTGCQLVQFQKIQTRSFVSVNNGVRVHDGSIRRRGCIWLSSNLFDVKKDCLPAVVFGESQYMQTRNAGHSKWANIKSTKTAKDLEKSKEINKYIRIMRVAAKEDSSKSPDPKINKKLANAIDAAKAAKIPTATIQRTLENMVKGFTKSGDFKMFTYPIKGPGGVIMLIELESNHIMKTKSEIIPILKKHAYITAEDSVLHLFTTKGVVLCTSLNGTPLKEDQLEMCIEHAIDAGASEVNWVEKPTHGNVMEFTTEPDLFYEVCKKLEKFNYEIVYNEVDYFPIQPVELTEEHIDLASKLYNKLIDSPDVIKLHDNIA